MFFQLKLWEERRNRKGGVWNQKQGRIKIFKEQGKEMNEYSEERAKKWEKMLSRGCKKREVN